MAPYPAHLLVVLHGLWGSRSHIQQICTAAERYAGKTSSAAAPRSRRRFTSPTRDDGTDSAAREESVRLVILPAKLNEWTNTYDGIDLCAERVVTEIDEEIERIAADGGRVERFSIVGYSLGGLVARYVLGLLDSRSPSFFQSVRPVNFTTFASPAIGIPTYKSFWSSLFRFLGARLLSRSGSQLYENDRFLVPSALDQRPNEKDKGAKKTWWKAKEDAEPLLKVMADPRYSFYQALLKFERVELYANIVNDRTVPFPTGAVEAHDPFALARAKAAKVAKKRGDDPDAPIDIRDGGLEIILDPNYPPLVQSFRPIDPSTALNKASVSGTPARSKPFYTRLRLPLLLRPTTYPFSRPVSLLVIVCLPLALPATLIYLIGRFMVQSRQSRRRIKDMRLALGDSTRGREGMLERVGVKIREVAEMTGVDNPEYAADLEDPEPPMFGDAEDGSAEAQKNGTERQPLRSSGQAPNGSKHAALSALSEPYDGIDTPPLARPLVPESNDGGTGVRGIGGDDEGFNTDAVLTPAQKEMIKNLNAIPQLRKHYTYMPPHVRNSHGAIVARDLRFEQHKPGLKVLQHWAEEFRM